MDMAFLLDTDVISETSRVRPDPRVVDFIFRAQNLLLPAAALMELQKGITEVCARDPIKAVKLSAWYNQLMSGEIPVIPTDKQVIDVWGTLSADPRLRNLIVPRPDAKRPRSGQDIHIAAAALVHRAAIATFNVRDYLLINDCYPLPGIYNPKEDRWYAKMEGLRFPQVAVTA